MSRREVMPHDPVQSADPFPVRRSTIGWASALILLSINVLLLTMQAIAHNYFERHPEHYFWEPWTGKWFLARFRSDIPFLGHGLIIAIALGMQSHHRQKGNWLAFTLATLAMVLSMANLTWLYMMLFSW